MTGFPCPVCRRDIPGRDQWPDLLLCPHCQQPVSVPPSLLTPAGPTAAFAPGNPAPLPATLADSPTLSAGPGGLPAELTDFLHPPQAPEEVGRLGGYRVLKVLGSGGMGVVYLAEDSQLQRLVALKVMLPTLAASPSARQRFLREARAAARLRHDHVVAIYHVGEDRGLPFLTMELLEGESLEECLQRRGKLPVAEALRVGREVAEGLAAAHEQGLIHRDIKPANVWLEEGRGRVKILDFGLARAAGDTSQLTQQGAVLGTPAYMAPEQARGEGVDPRCDLFSLGCVLYRMTTGSAPFKGGDAIATLMAVCTEQPPPPHERNPEVPRALSGLVTRMLEKEAGKRPDSARAVAEALASLPPDEKGVPPAPSLAAKRLRGRRKLVAAALLLATGVAVLFLAGRARRREDAPPSPPDPPDPAFIPAHGPPDPDGLPPGFESLFNGKDLSGWKVAGGKSDNWIVDPGRKAILTLGADQSWLLTQKEYADFELRLECRVVQRANSGVALRTSAGPFPGGKLPQGMEVQVADDAWHRTMFNWYGPKNLTGGIFDLVAPSSEAARKVGEWNALRISATGTHVRVELNGTRVVHEDLAKFEGKAPNHPGLLAPRGHIGLQSFQGRAEFRRIAVRPR